jgi:hypothetical protein
VRRPVSARRGIEGRARSSVAVALRTIRDYGFAAWVYVAVVAAFRPEQLAEPVAQLPSWPRLDTVGALCFALSAAAGFNLSLLGRSAR